eukprot:gb/GECG01011930.1/.p1 GENE.gb/GECG01011930.1/~~gb/GECG01011930.1/.p1  ORF type:complete len:1066 (+),score=135.25 gb/GECG01011930.1/:1-3198(+)
MTSYNSNPRRHAAIHSQGVDNIVHAKSIDALSQSNNLCDNRIGKHQFRVVSYRALSMARRGAKRQRSSSTTRTTRQTRTKTSTETSSEGAKNQEEGNASTEHAVADNAGQDGKEKAQRVEASGESDVKSGSASADRATHVVDQEETAPTQSSNPYVNEFSQESAASESGRESSANMEQEGLSTSDNPFLPSSSETQDNDPTQNNVLEAMLSFVLEDRKKKQKQRKTPTHEGAEKDTGAIRHTKHTGAKKPRMPRFVGRIPAKDWSVKDRAIFISSQSFEWIALQSTEEDFTHTGEGVSSGYEDTQEDANFGRLIPFSALDEVALEGDCHSRVKELAKSFQYRWDYRQFTPRNSAVWRHEHMGTLAEEELPVNDFNKFMKSVISCLNPTDMPPGPYIFRIVHNILRRAFDDARRYYCSPSSDFVPQVYTGMVAASRRLINAQSVNENDKVEGSRFFRILNKWHQSLRNVASKVVSGAQEYAIVKYENKNIVILRRASENTRSGPVAIIARSTRGTRNILRRVGIPFSMPLSSNNINDNEDIPEELKEELNSYQSISGVRKGNRRGSTRGLSAEHTLLLIRGEVSFRRLISYMCADISAGFLGSAAQGDNRVVGGLQTELISLGLTSTTGRIPRILALSSFKHATEEHLEIVKNGKLPRAASNKASYDMYRLEISGPVLPSVPHRLVHILGHAQLLLHCHTLAMRLIVSQPVRHTFAEAARSCINEKVYAGNEHTTTSDLEPQCRESYAADFTAQMFDCTKEASLQSDNFPRDARGVRIGYWDQYVTEGTASRSVEAGSTVEDEDIDEESYSEARDAILQCTFPMDRLCTYMNSSLLHKAVVRQPKITTSILEECASSAASQRVSLQHSRMVGSSGESYSIPRMTIWKGDELIRDEEEDGLLTIKERVPDAFANYQTPLTLGSVRCICLDLWDPSFKTLISEMTKLRNEAAASVSNDGQGKAVSRECFWPWSGSDDLDDYYAKQWYTQCVLRPSQQTQEGYPDRLAHVQWCTLVGKHGGPACSVDTPVDNNGTPLQWTPCFLAARAAAAKTMARCALGTDVNSRTRK